LKGITTQLIKLRKNVNNGAIKNIKKTALVGRINSLITNFNPSAIGCKIPQKPTTLGPTLL